MFSAQAHEFAFPATKLGYLTKDDRLSSFSFAVKAMLKGTIQNHSQHVQKYEIFHFSATLPAEGYTKANKTTNSFFCRILKRK